MSACQPPSTSPMRQRSSTTHVVEEDDVRALARQRVHRLDLDTRLVELHEEHREPRVLRDVRVGAGEEEDVVGDVGVGREHLLTVHHPPVAVARGPGAAHRRRRSPTSGSVMPRAMVTSPRRNRGMISAFIRRCRPPG